MGDSCGSLTKVAADLRQPTYDPPTALQETTTYYWKVVAKNDCGSTEGPCWSFTTACDTVAAGDTHTPLADTGNTAGPYAVCATVTDNMGVGAVTLYWNKNGGIVHVRSDDRLGHAEPVLRRHPRPERVGDRYCYYIEATDSSTCAGNTTRSPATGENCFDIIDCRPPAPTNPSPADGATGVSVGASLSWVGALAASGQPLANPHWLVVGSSTTNINEAATALGATVSTTTDFSTASLTGIDVVIFGIDISAGHFTRDAATKAKLAAYVTSGGGLYVELGGDSTYMDYSWVPNYGIVSTSSVAIELISIADPGHPIAAGVTDAGLDNWGTFRAWGLHVHGWIGRGVH